MNESLIDVLACPDCRAPLDIRAESGAPPRGLIETGVLICTGCGRTFPIRGGIPRFVDPDTYASNFGLQWTLFREIQLDSYNGSTLSRDRLLAETGLDLGAIGGKWILEAGCGAGRFLEVLSGTGARVVGLDLSAAVDASRRTVGNCPDMDIVQASILALPFRDATFDVCYSIGVMQHTPDPDACLRALPRLLKPGGQIAVTVYERRTWTKLHAKYLVRPWTRKWDQARLLATIIETMPFFYPLLRRLFAIPKLGRALHFFIPVADCSRLPGLGEQDRYRFTILDTFDMLSPTYDSPMTEPEVRGALAAAGVTGLRRKSPTGLNIVGTMPA